MSGSGQAALPISSVCKLESNWRFKAPRNSWEPLSVLDRQSTSGHVSISLIMEPGRKMEIQMKSTLLNCVLIVGLCPLAAAQLRLPGAAHVESREKPGPLYITWMVHVDPSNWTLPNKFDHGCFILDQMADIAR